MLCQLWLREFKTWWKFAFIWVYLSLLCYCTSLSYCYIVIKYLLNSPLHSYNEIHLMCHFMLEWRVIIIINYSIYASMLSFAMQHITPIIARVSGLVGSVALWNSHEYNMSVKRNIGNIWMSMGLLANLPVMCVTGSEVDGVLHLAS